MLQAPLQGKLVTTPAPATITCTHCGKEFQWVRSSKYRGFRPPQYCSHECRHAAWRQKMETTWAKTRRPIKTLDTAPSKSRQRYKSQLYIDRLLDEIKQAGGLEEYLNTRLELNPEERRALVQLAYRASATDHELIHRFLAQISPLRN